MDYTEQGVGTRKSLVPVEWTKASNFDHETPVPVEDAQYERIEATVKPVGGATGDGPYTFEIPSQNDSYLVMSTIGLHVTAQVKRSDGTNLVEADDLGPVNSLGTVMFENVEIMVNDRLLNPASAANSHYKSYIETVLSYEKSAESTHLRSQLFAMDTAGKFETFTEDNKGFTERAVVVKNSRTFDMFSPIMADFLRANNHLAPGHKLTIKLTRAPDAFLLCGPAALPSTYKLHILSMELHYDRIRLRESVPTPRIERYLMTGTVLKKFPIAQNMQTETLKIHNGGVKPKTVIVGMVRTSAAEGTLRRNPLYLEHFNVSELQLKIDGKPVPSAPYKPNFNVTPKLVNREYSALFRNTGAFRMDRGNLIDRVMWESGCTLFAWDLTVDRCNGFHLHQSTEGVIELDLTWRQALTNPITVLVYLAFDECYIRPKGETEFIRQVI